ncbi:MAG: peptidoglycan DD-metalloendopeptidase family protein [Eubacteriales bacterium]
MKKIISVIMIFGLLLGNFQLQFVYATADQDKLGDVNDKISAVQSKLSHGKAIEKSLNSKIKTLDNQIQYKENQINKLESDINHTNTKITQAQADLDATSKAMGKQSDGLNKRLRAMYKNGDVGLVEIVLGSSSMADFMTNIDMVQKILDNDVEILKGIKVKYASIAEKKKTLLSLQNEITYQRNVQADTKNQLEGDITKASSLRSQVAKSNKELERQIDELNKEANDLIAKIRALQGDQAYYGGKLGWPTPGYYRITSPFGYRMHPILHVYKLHTGIDIAVPANSNVVAANGGIVIFAAWSGSYGNMVMIDHGGGIVTLYAHNNKFKVSKGDKVTKGQVVALSGSTGASTGPHVHFEVRNNGKYEDPMKWLK